MPTSNLVIEAGQSIGLSHGYHGPVRVTIRDGRITQIDLPPFGREAVDYAFPRGMLLPGLVDLHAHPIQHGSIFGVDPDRELLPHGVTTVLSQGDLGSRHLESYLQAHTVRARSMRVCIALNLSAWGESRMGGCFQTLDDADVEAAVTAIQSASGQIWGLSINVSHLACPGVDPREILSRGLQVAQQTGKPILYGMRRPEDWPMEEQLQLLRPGDVVTYIYRVTPHCLVERGHVRPEFHAARARGILFDVGHGRGSFDFATAETAIADGFPPDTISTDFQLGHVGQQPHQTLPRVVSKLIVAGLPEADVWRAVTSTPARILGLPELGKLQPGGPADCVVLSNSPGTLTDTTGNSRQGPVWETELVIRDGIVVRS